MSDTQRVVRIFISSPGDVVEERNQARRVIEGLQKRYSGITLQPVLWEELALPATASFQETIDLILHQRPIDIAVFILWSRLGSPLSSRVSRPDGTPYRSGTEREFDLMLTAFEQSGNQRPVMLAYTRDDAAGFQQKLTRTPLNELEELLSQRKLAESFIREQFHDADGRNLRAYQTYREPVDFVGRLRTHLQQTLADLLGADAAPRWHEEPYRGLEVFDVRHADIFCGRDEETCDLLQRLRDQRRSGCAFAVIVGASGSGKSSLARAGVAATLLQHANDDGVKEWRTAFFTPSLAEIATAFAPKGPNSKAQGNALGSGPDSIGSPVGAKLNRSNALTDQPPVTSALLPSNILSALTQTLLAAVPELRTSMTSLDDIAAGLAQDAGLTTRLSITPAFARTAESAKGEMRLLLVIDQMEELWTDRRITPEDRDQFFAVIEALSRSGHVTVLATLRSDFYPHAQQVPTFLRLKGERGHFDLLPPSAAALQRLIVEPARLAGLTFERQEQTNRSLDEIILQDAARDPTVLPLLQYALSELYRLRSNDDSSRHRVHPGGSRALPLQTSPTATTASDRAREPLAQGQRRSGSAALLTFAAYEALGGVEGALGQRAEEIFQQLPQPAREALPELLPLLVTVDVAGEQSAVRRRTPLPERSDPPTAQQQLIDRLIAARFLTTDRQGDVPVVSLAHEALLRRWDRIAQWVTSNREHLRLRARVEHSQHRWASQGQHASLLLPTGLPLEEGQVLLREARPLLLAETTDYIERSITHRQSESRRQRLIRTTALTMSLTAALIAILAALWINTERNAALDAKTEESKAKTAVQVEAQKAKEAQETAEKQQAAALRENANHYWRLAVNIRDSKDPDPIRASHLFLRGAQSLDQIVTNQSTAADKAFLRSEAHAAGAVDRRYVRTWAHDGPVIGCVVSRDESRVLTWSEDKTVRLWDVTKPEPVQTFNHEDRVRGAQFSRDESRVLTWSWDKTVRLWDVTKTEPLQTFKHEDRVKGAQFSRDELRVLSWSTDKTARLWDVTKTEPLQVFKHDDYLTGAQFSQNELRVLTWSNDKTARLWDVTKTEPLQVFKHENQVHGAQFSRDGSRVLTWCGDWTARLWDVTKPDLLQTFKHDRDVYGAQFNQNESRVLTWSEDRTARLWDVTKPDPIETFKHEGSVLGAQFSRNESTVLTWSGDNTARLWNMTEPKTLWTFKHDSPVLGAQFNRDESRMLTWSNDKTARLWDVTKSEPLQTFKHDDDVRGAQFSQDESRVLTWSGNPLSEHGDVRFWDVSKLESVYNFEHDSGLNGPKFSRDESHVLTWSGDKTARLWDVTQPEPLRTLTHDKAVIGAQFSRDESRVLTWSRDNTARLWDVTNPKPIQTFKHDSSVLGAQFSRDELRVLTWSDDSTTRLWDVTNTDPIQTFKHDSGVLGAQFSRDESRVLTWSRDNTARLWDVTKTEPIQTFKHDQAVMGAQFSSDESRVLTWSGQLFSITSEARLWDVTKTEPIQSFKHDDTVNGAKFSRDESHVLTWSGDGTARLWDVTKSEPIQTFKHDSRVNGAQFSRDESRVLTWSLGVSNGEARLWDVTKPEPLQTFKHDGGVNGAQFSRDESRVLTWSNDKTVRLWNAVDPLAMLTPAERILELEVRSAKTLDANLNLRTLSFAEWQAKVQSPEYRAIEQKLPQRK